MLTAIRLREVIHYDPETGVFTWKTRPVRRGMERADNAFNTRKAGNRAGYIRPAKKRSPSYVIIGVDQTRYLAHRLAWLYMTGEWPEEMVDHRDRDGLNNRWKNLRAATCTQNNINSGIPSNNTTGFKGVCFDKKNKRYLATIRIDKRLKNLGRFDSPEEAHAAYLSAAKSHYGEFARSC